MRKFLGHLSIALALILAGASGAAAQSPGGPLKGTSLFKFFATDLNQDGIACGLDKGAFQSAFMSWPRDKGLQITDSSGYWISVRATTVRMDNDLCVTNVDASVMVNSSYFNPATASERVGRIQLWTNASLQISSRSVHASAVTDAFRELGRALAEDWQRDQY